MAGFIAPYKDLIVSKVGELGSYLGTWAVGAVTAAASGTLTFFLALFVMLYGTFFFLVDGREILRTAHVLSAAPVRGRRPISRGASCPWREPRSKARW